MIIMNKIISLAIIIGSIPVGMIIYYIISPLPKKEKKQYIEELLSQLINFVIFIWIAKIILNLPLFITDPIVVLTYPSNSQAFYLALLFSALWFLYKKKKTNLNFLMFIKSSLFILLTSSFTYELIQIGMNNDTYRFGYLALLTTLLCLYLLISERINTHILISIIFIGWSIGMLFLVYNQSFITVFGYLMAPWFIWVTFIVSLLFFIIILRKWGFYSERN